MKHLAPPNGNVCAIGDPDQAIYRFRGADARFFSAFGADHPGASMVRLTRNYRSDRNIVSLSSQVIAKSGSRHRAVPVIDEAPDLVTVHEAPTEKAEAEFIVQSLEQAVGGHSFFSIDSGRTTETPDRDLSFSDFAVLYRTEAQAAPIVEALERSGLPFQQRSHHRLLDYPGVAGLIDALLEAPASGSVRERLEAGRYGRRAGRGRRERAGGSQGAAPAHRGRMRRRHGTVSHGGCAGRRNRYLGPEGRPDFAPDPARRQGTRVPGRHHRRLRGRSAPLDLGHTGPRGSRRGAAPLLCRRYPCEVEALPHPGGQAAMAGQGAAAPSLALPGRH